MAAISVLSLAVTLRSQSPNADPYEILLPDSAAIPLVEVHNHKKYPEKYAIVYAPISVGLGRVRTAEFPVEKKRYNILLQFDKPLPFDDMICLIGNPSVAFSLNHCSNTHPVLQADWTVWEGGHVVHAGSTEEQTGCKYTRANIFACIGAFVGEVGKKYVVQVHFTKDGTPLNVANPRLVVIKHDKFW